MVIVKRRGRFVVDFYEDGRRRRLSFKTRADAEAFMKSDHSATDVNERSTVLSDTTLKEAIKRYYGTKSVGKMVDTYRNEKYIFERFFKFMQGQKVMLLSEVKLLHLDAFRSELQLQRKASTVNRMFNVYKAFFSKCVDWEMIAKSPAEKLKKLPEDETEAVLWDDEQLRQVLAHLPSWAADVIYFLAETSARPIEARRLVWSDVDFKAGIVRLKSFKGTGEARIRKFDLTPEVAEFLSELEKKARSCGRAGREDRVFLNSKGGEITRNRLCFVVRETRRKLGYEELTSYGLRHTYLTQLIDMNTNLRTVQVIAGHSRSTQTERYTRVKDNQVRNVIMLAHQKRNLKRTTGHSQRAEKVQPSVTTGHKPVTDGGNCTTPTVTKRELSI